MSRDIELLHKAGLSGVLRIQDRVHNKGIVVDSGTILVSSQNWSGDGTLRNRDAGVIICHAGIARYFEQIFLQDWEKRADARVK
ncbi:MAG: phospholipase D-like domain-containing protein [Vicinamibacterales bacterium]